MARFTSERKKQATRRKSTFKPNRLLQSQVPEPKWWYVLQFFLAVLHIRCMEWEVVCSIIFHCCPNHLLPPTIFPFPQVLSSQEPLHLQLRTLYQFHYMTFPSCPQNHLCILLQYASYKWI